MRWVVCSGLILVAAFCGYGFLAAGELSGTPETLWKTGYAAVGAVALVGALMAAVDRRRGS